MESLIDKLPNIIHEAAQSNLGILALLSIALSILAYHFFARSSEKIKVGIFALLFLGVVGFGSAMFLVNPGVKKHTYQDQNNSLVNYNGYQPKQFDGRVGKIFVKNTSLYEFKVTLWHPDSKDIFNSWVISGTAKEYLKQYGSAFSIGNNWGIQIGESKIKSIDDVSIWKGSEWYVSQDRFFK